MSERCIVDDYQLRGNTYSIWIDSSRNWWLSGGHKPGHALTEDDFDPKLTDKEVNDINTYIDDYLEPDC